MTVRSPSCLIVDESFESSVSQALDRIAPTFRTFVEFKSIAIALFELPLKIQLLVVLKTNAHRQSVLFNHGLIGRRIVATDRFRTSFVYIFPVSIKISTGVAR